MAVFWATAVKRVDGLLMWTCGLEGNELDNHRSQPGVWRTNKHFSSSLPLDGDAFVTKRILWRLTDDAYREGAEQLARIEAQRQVAAETMDTSADFSLSPSVEFVEATRLAEWDQPLLEDWAREVSKSFLIWPGIAFKRCAVGCGGSRTSTGFVRRLSDSDFE